MAQQLWLSKRRALSGTPTVLVTEVKAVLCQDIMAWARQVDVCGAELHQQIPLPGSCSCPTVVPLQLVIAINIILKQVHPDI